MCNWRCIEDLELDLARLNVFIGGNSTGKSSLAYSVYMASKSSRVSDARSILTQLYGYDFNWIVRKVEGKPQFPILIKIADSEFSVKLKQLPEFPEVSEKVEKREVGEKDFDITSLQKSPWTDEYLLPSRRVDYLHIVMFLPKMMRELKAKPEAETLTRMFGGWIGGLFELFKALPILPPFGIFASDYTRALTGLRLESVRGEFRDAGAYILNIPLYLSVIDVITQDPYTKLQLPVELAPDGLTDFLIFDAVTQKIPENSLIVIEEPEVYKNPLRIMEFTEHIVKRVLNRKLTLIMTTHSDIPLTTMAKLVAEGKLKIEDIKVFYFKRDPWTKISEIKFFEDGTIEQLPDTEKLITYLF